MYKNLNTLERQILFEIAKTQKEKINSYSVYRKFRIPIHEVASSVYNLEKGEYIFYKDDFLVLAPKGAEWISNSRMDLEDETNRYWRKIPEIFLARKNSINEPYVPYKKYLSKHILKMRENNGD